MRTSGCILERLGPCSTNCGSGRQTFKLFCEDYSDEEFIDEFELSCESSTGCQGGWSEWVPFGECSTTCDGGQKVVKRRCDNPYPGRDSEYCDGDDVKYVYCNMGGCPGVWGNWTQFGECSTSCDEGQMLFTRKCNHPLPGHLATDCDGENIENRTCNLRGCPGSWSCWEDDGHCSTSCGNGTQIRQRRCNNPAPSNNGVECAGENVTSVQCIIKECPVYKWGHLKELNLTKDDLKEMMKEELNEMKTNLTIESGNMSANIRKRISALDDRPSAAFVGYVGVALLLIPLVMIISFDASMFFAVVANIYRKVCKRKSV
ncbi:coadhesin-like [Mytilus californianus]|uniref:coadhesin-like n=1 Tax=Mytilus californianus TaxID=6549 RepID=UPI0022453654|nr:coadhesin-like [Mytilus californianus]